MSASTLAARCRPPFAIGLLLLLSLAGSIPVRAQGDHARVRGMVRAQSGRALADVRIDAVGGDSTRTDARGQFALHVATGRAVTLRITRPGYRAESITFPSLVAGAEHRLALTLIPLVPPTVLQDVSPSVRPVVNAIRATTIGVVEGEALRPLPTGRRDRIALGFTAPGVAQARGC